MSVANAVARRCHIMPAQPRIGIAVVCDPHTVTWSELDRIVNRLAGHLAERVLAGRRVALHLPDGPALVLLFLAACRAGREVQILDPSWPQDTALFAITALSPGIGRRRP